MSAVSINIMRTRGQPLLTSIWCAGFLAITTGFAGGGTITLETSVAAQLDDGAVHCELTISNSGNETAINVQAHVFVSGFEVSSRLIPEVGSGQVVELVVEMPQVDLVPGRHHLLVVIEYTDINGYALSAVAHARLDSPESSRSEVLAHLAGSEIAGAGRLEVSVKNESKSTHAAETRLWLPRELSCAETQQTVTLAAGAEAKVEFDVHNFSALPGSKYAVLVVVDYEWDGTHYSTLAPASVTIVMERAFFDRHWPLIVGVLFGVLILLLVVGVWSSRRRSPVEERAD